MDNKELKELLKKCFGKEKDDRYHAVAMLVIYSIFLFILVIAIRLGGNHVLQEVETKPTSTISPSPTQVIENNDSSENFNSTLPLNDVNYSYSYTITKDGNVETFLGKKVDDKEKFTHIKDGIMTEYAILSEHYLILKDGFYHIVETPNFDFKYCDVEKILSVISNQEQEDNQLLYSVSNQEIAAIFNDHITYDNFEKNTVDLKIENQILREVNIDFSHYISSLMNQTITFTIHMEFVDVGTTEDFEIKVL